MYIKTILQIDHDINNKFYCGKNVITRYEKVTILSKGLGQEKKVKNSSSKYIAKTSSE